MKEGYIVKALPPEDGGMELINRYTRTPLTADKVYTFSVILCDNEVDRDYEVFSTESLKKLSELFIGKTGIFDHDRKSSNQTARIYSTEVQTDSQRKTALGQEYTYLTAQAYIPKTEKNTEVIEKIESGILKEVSIGCSVKKSVCNICGKEGCSHIKGKEYKGQPCVRILNEPMDAYEFSFVAVPAQRNAGVKKSYEEEVNLTEKMKNLMPGQEVILSYAEAAELKKAAGWGESYRQKLCDSVKSYSRVVQPELSERVMDKITENADLETLTELDETYRKMAEDILPINPQLKNVKQTVIADNGNFRI